MASESHEAVEEMSDARVRRWSISVEDEKEHAVEVRQTRARGALRIWTKGGTACADWTKGGTACADPGALQNSHISDPRRVGTVCANARVLLHYFSREC